VPSSSNWLFLSQALPARLIRFGLVGGMTSAAYGLVVAGLVSWVSEPVAAALAYLALLPLNYIGHRRTTFRSDAPRWPEQLRYLMMHAVTLVACMAAMQGITAGLGASHWTGSAVIIVLAPVLNFALMHLWVFRARPPELKD
jgi:putative flippase GtrA